MAWETGDLLVSRTATGEVLELHQLAQMVKTVMGFYAIHNAQIISMESVHSVGDNVL